MELQELKAQLDKKHVLPFYVFTGSETEIMDIYVRNIATAANMPIKRPDNLGVVYSKLMSNTLMDRPNCYVIRDDKEFMQQEKLWDRLTKQKVQGKNIMIFVYSDLDKRTKFYKYIADRLVTFDRLTPEVLAKYIKRDTGLDITHAIEFASICDCDYGRIRLEQDKLTIFAEVNKLPVDQAYKQAKKEQLFFTAPRDLIFELIDAACTRNAAKSYAIWEELKEKGENPLAILSLLYTNYRSILLVQSVGSPVDVPDKTGLSAWQVKMAQAKAGKYNIGELVENLRSIRWTEKGIKTGMIEQDMAIDYVLGEVLY